MHTRILMMASAAVLFAAGLACTFAPQELVLRAGGTATGPFLVLLVQVAGGLYLGFAMMNWMARASLIGGIYGRPIAMGNFLHFGIVASALGKAAFGAGGSILIWTAALVYVAFAVWFGLVLFGDPLKKKVAEQG